MFFLFYVLELTAQGYRKATVVLDNFSAHKNKMRNLLALLMYEFVPGSFEIEFLNTPAYSPKLNLAEYSIHQIRLNYLHHLPVDATLEQVEQRLKDKTQEKQLQTPEQIVNTLEHICKIPYQN